MPINLKKFFKDLFYRKSNVIQTEIQNGIPKVIEDCCSDTSQWTFVLALVAILLGAVLVNLWIRVINNFTYHTLKLNPDSSIWALIIALIFTGILVLYIALVLDSDTSNAVKQNITGVSFVATMPALTGAMSIDMGNIDTGGL
jgi:cytochrome c biogenesis protein CcdA